MNILILMAGEPRILSADSFPTPLVEVDGIRWCSVCSNNARASPVTG